MMRIQGYLDNSGKRMLLLRWTLEGLIMRLQFSCFGEINGSPPIIVTNLITAQNQLNYNLVIRSSNFKREKSLSIPLLSRNPCEDDNQTIKHTQF